MKVKNKPKVSKKIVISLICVVSLTFCSIIAILIKNKINNNMCIVQFDTMGGNLVESQNVKCGNKIIKPDNPQKEGFEFVDWYNNIDVFDFDSVIDTNIILTAKWEVKDGVKTVKVHFDTNGGTSINDYEVLLGGIITAPIDPQKDGYEFEYWLLDNKRFDFKSKIESEITLVAKWKKSKKESNVFLNVFSNDDNSSNNNTNSDYIVKKDSYECWGGFSSSANDKKLKIYDFWNFNYLWSIPYEYAGSDKCFFTYKTSNDSVISIDKYGNTNPNGAGTAYLSKCINDTKTNEEITCVSGKIIIDENPVQEITCSSPQWTIVEPGHSSGYSIYPNDVKSVHFNIKPDDFIDKNLTISVDDPSIIEIVKKVNTGYYDYKALKPGTTKIRLTSSNGVSGYCEYTVERKIPQLGGVTINRRELSLYEGESTTLSFTLSPSDAIVTDYGYNWETSNNSIVTVDSSGRITAKSEGSADVTINFGGNIKDSCHVVVTKKPFSATGSIAYTIVTTSQGTYSGVKAEINASGGSGNYRYTIVLYKEGQKVSERSNSSINNTVAFTGNGTYTADYTVTDGDGNVFSGTIGPTVISVQ